MLNESYPIWLIIFVLAVLTYLIRFSFLGIIGNRALPDWILRHLRYTGVAVLPGMVTPLVFWPAATNGQTDPARLLAAVVTLSVGSLTKNVYAGLISGGLTLFLGLTYF